VPLDAAVARDDRVPTDVPMPDPTFEYAMLPNYPNPFSESTTLRYTLAAPSQARLTIYNVLGQHTRDLVDEYQLEGAHEVEWDARDDGGQRVAAGLYVSRLQVPGIFDAQDKMTLLGGGYSRVTDLDEELRRRGVDWSLVRDGLSAPDPVFGYARALSPAHAALKAGQAWARLEVTALFHVDASQAAVLADRLVELAGAIDSTQVVYEPLASALRRLPSLAHDPASYERTRQALERLLQRQPDAVPVHFYLGEWLGSLELGARTARRLSIPLESVADPTADAAVARQYLGALANLGADEHLLASLRSLNEALEGRPSTPGQVFRLVELLSQFR
jgi:hypothetical protein